MARKVVVAPLPKGESSLGCYESCSICQRMHRMCADAEVKPCDQVAAPKRG